jgi:uncharacterized protein (DUF3084 family)
MTIEQSVPQVTMPPTLNDLVSQMQDGFKSIKDEFQSFRSEVQAGFNSVKGEFQSVRSEIQSVRDEVQSFRNEVQTAFNSVKDEFRSLRGELGQAKQEIHLVGERAMATNVRLDQTSSRFFAQFVSHFHFACLRS